VVNNIISIDLNKINILEEFMQKRFAMFAGFIIILFVIIFSAEILKAEPQNQSSKPVDKSYEFGISAGIWFAGGDVSFDNDPYFIDAQKTNSFLMKAFLDAYAGPHVAIGIYGHFAPTVGYDETSSTQRMLEFGFAVKPRFVINNTIALKPGLGIGYRRYSSSEKTADSIQAMGANFMMEVQFLTISPVFTPYFEFGFLAQPVGGNSDWSMTFPPIWYAMVGVAF
jgi:hypothetical protein